MSRRWFAVDFCVSTSPKGSFSRKKLELRSLAIFRSWFSSLFRLKLKMSMTSFMGIWSLRKMRMMTRSGSLGRMLMSSSKKEIIFFLNSHRTRVSAIFFCDLLL